MQLKIFLHWQRWFSNIKEGHWRSELLWPQRFLVILLWRLSGWVRRWGSTRSKRKRLNTSRQIPPITKTNSTDSWNGEPFRSVRHSHCTEGLFSLIMSMFIDTLATHDWSLPRQNTTFHKLLITTPVTRFIMGISKEFGVEAVWFCPKPFDSNNFGASLTQIRSNHHYPAYLFLDNSSWHTSAATKNNMKRLGFRWIFNLLC